jgi:hypothetical protein
MFTKSLTFRQQRGPGQPPQVVDDHKTSHLCHRNSKKYFVDHKISHLSEAIAISTQVPDKPCSAPQEGCSSQKHSPSGAQAGKTPLNRAPNAQPDAGQQITRISSRQGSQTRSPLHRRQHSA